MSVLTKTQTLVIGGVVAVVVIAGGTTYALTGNSKKATATPTPTVTASKPKATPTPTKTAAAPKPKPAAVNPLTGEGKPPTGPIIAVKIDDTANGRPSRGLDQSDVIYIEQAEGGLTRMVAVFGTHKPLVEAVRSVRASDPELLSQYGGITLVASGGGGDSLTTLDASPVKGIIHDRGNIGFSLDDNRGAPYNLESNLAEVSAQVHTAGSQSIGFTWSKTDARLARSKTDLTPHTVVGGTSVDFRWSTSLRRYVRIIDGTPVTAMDGALVAKPNVLVQLCRVTVNPNDVDVNGNPSQYTHTVGSGTVVLYRNGKRIVGRWSRPQGSAPTTYTDLHGKPLTMSPGGMFVALAATGATVS